jgi:hypothetical protein
MTDQGKNERRAFLKRTIMGAGLASVMPEVLAADFSRKSVTGNNPPVGGKHKNLFNGDTCVYFYNPEKWQPEDYKFARVKNPRTGKLNEKETLVGGPFSKKAIHNFVKELAANGIDTFISNANASRAWYPSKTIPSILDGYKRGDRDFFRGHAICQGITEPEAVEDFLDTFTAFMDRYQDLLDAGTDWLAETTVACRKNKISPWVSIRMNDLHGSGNFEGSFFNLPLLKLKEMRLQKSAYGPHSASYREGLNYEKAEVRDIMFRQIREVVEDYDFEGLELDWWRQPLCCEPNASQATIDMMSNWIREIRALTKKRAAKTGKPYPFGMRIPGRLDILKSIGLDIVTLCREGTLDFICPSGFWCTTWDMPHDQLKELLGPNTTVYGVIEDGANALATLDPERQTTQRLRYMSASRELLHANAAGKLALGAQGIEWFNFYCTDQARIPGILTDYASLRQINDLQYLRGKPKHYTLAIGGRSFNLIPFELPAQLPVALEPVSHHPFRIAMCKEPAGNGHELVVQVVVKAEDTITHLPVSFNGCWPNLEKEATELLLFPLGSYTHHVPAHKAYNFRFPVSLIREGWNEIVIENGGKSAFTIACIELAVRNEKA